jgi:hypothetical protein
VLAMHLGALSIRGDGFVEFLVDPTTRRTRTWSSASVKFAEVRGPRARREPRCGGRSRQLPFWTTACSDKDRSRGCAKRLGRRSFTASTHRRASRRGWARVQIRSLPDKRSSTLPDAGPATRPPEGKAACRTESYSNFSECPTGSRAFGRSSNSVPAVILNREK